MASSKSSSLVSELESFLEELKSYQGLLEYLRERKTILGHQLRERDELRERLVRKSGKLRQIIAELTGKQSIEQLGGVYDMWSTGLTAHPSAPINTFSLGACIDATNEAIGKLASDIRMGIRDLQGNLIKEEETAIISGLPPKAFIAKANWKDIENEFGITKVAFGRAINFVSDSFKRNIIFRDVEHAFLLASTGFSKPAVILAGGVIEELLRLYLEHKNISPISNNFDGYIKTCEQKELLKSGISRLSDSVRHFRNLVHLSKEETKRYTISKSTAKGAVASIFTIANDF